MSREELISRIKDEVNDLHPMLIKLLAKLPGITDVEYTHGSNEMGADLVLAKKHESLGHIQYVGIVAKVGKVHQDLSDIERQISECFTVPRYFRNGKEEVYISEVWVIATQNVTGGAQRKIRANFVSRSIEFIDGKRLEALINAHLPVYWIDLPLYVSDYLNTLRNITVELDRRLSLIDIGENQFYVEQDIDEQPEFDYRRRRISQKRRIDIHQEIRKERFLLIEGGMGTGKSKLLRQLTNHYTNPEIYKTTNLLPILCTYKDLSDSYHKDIEQLISATIAPEMLSQIEEVKYLVLIDGFDEKRNTSGEQLEALSALRSQVINSPNYYVILATRYLPGLQEANSLRREIACYEIRPLTLSKTITFIQTLCTKLDIKNRIIEDLKRSPLFKDLPRSPIAAILLAKLLNEGSEELPSNMTELYSKYSELMLGRWDMKKGLQSEKEYEALNNITMQLAEHMILNEMDNISLVEAKAIVDTYLSRRNLNLNNVEIFDRLINRTEIVIANNQMQILSFKHRTFTEFFYAKSVLHSRDFQIDNRAFQLYWLNTFFFYLGLRRDCPDIVDAITRMFPTSQAERWLKMINMGNYLLAAYASPYDTIREGIKKVMLDAAQLYLDTIAMREESPFGHLPQMGILWLVQMLIRGGYSYTFFQDALESAAVAIATDDFDKDSYDPEIKPYALFLLNVAYIELDENQTFDLLFELYPDPLPLDLSLTLRRETKNLSERTRLMRKQDKRVKKLLKGNQNLANIVEKMYETPVRQIKQRN
ncbi:MAG: hypothetical protein KJ069_23855 [Anaerolineae bacterium]|nr:hypothetical protein [Anaerolineae bacterium]